MRASRLSNQVTKSIRLFTQAATAHWRGRAAVNELASCGAPELARVAQDLGISAADLYSLASRDKTAADLLLRRLEALRLDPTSVDPTLMRDLQRCCSSCDSKQLCAHEIEDEPKGARWPKYRPNEETIATFSTKPMPLESLSDL